MAAGTPYSRISDNVALIVGTATKTVLVAPGVGFSYRILAAILWVNRTATGVTDVLLNTVGIPTDILAEARGLRLDGTTNLYVLLPPPGQQVGDNAALEIRAPSTVAAGAGGCTIFYVTDTLT